MAELGDFGIVGMLSAFLNVPVQKGSSLKTGELCSSLSLSTEEASVNKELRQQNLRSNEKAGSCFLENGQIF